MPSPRTPFTSSPAASSDRTAARSPRMAASATGASGPIEEPTGEPAGPAAPSASRVAAAVTESRARRISRLSR